MCPFKVATLLTKYLFGAGAVLCCAVGLVSVLVLVSVGNRNGFSDSNSEGNCWGVDEEIIREIVKG